MQIHANYSGLQKNGAPIVTPQPKRVATTPLRDGDQAQEDHGQNQNGGEANQDRRLVFRTLFTDATQAGLTAAKGTPVRAPERPEHEKPEFVRAEKRPEKGPVPLSDQAMFCLLT